MRVVCDVSSKWAILAQQADSIIERYGICVCVRPKNPRDGYTVVWHASPSPGSSVLD